jgi:hypothetical protein
MSRFAKTETRVSFVTNGGTPAEQERSETATDAANALLEQTRSEIALRKAALHACVFDVGAVKKVEDDEDAGPEVEHVHAWEVLFDGADAHRGKPKILVHRQTADKDALIAKFVDEPKDGEEESPEARDARLDLTEKIEKSGGNGLVTADHTVSEQHCLVYELWRLPVGRRPGRHVIVTDTALLLDEVWTGKTFPFVFFGWSEPLTGAYPVSIANIVSALQGEIDGIRNRSSQIMRQMAVATYELEGPVTDTAPLETQIRVGSSAIGDIVQHNPGTNIKRISADNVRGRELPDEEDRAWSKGFEMVGISESSAIGSRPAGLNSAPAQREWNEINQDRLSLVALDYQQAHVDLASLLLDDVAERPEYEISVKDPNGKWMRKVRAADLNLGDSDYVIQKFPIGALPTTPTGRLAAAADLLQMKAITPEQFQQISQIPDLKSEIDVNLATRRATEKIIGRIIATGKYEAPLEMMDLTAAAKYAVARYLQGVADDLDDDRLAKINDFIEECRSKLEAKAPKLAAPAPGAGPVGPMPPDIGGLPLPATGGIAPAALAPPPPQMPLPGAEIGIAA